MEAILLTGRLPSRLGQLEPCIKQDVFMHFKRLRPACPLCHSSEHVSFRYFNNKEKARTLQPRYACKNLASHNSDGNTNTAATTDVSDTSANVKKRPYYFNYMFSGHQCKQPKLVGRSSRSQKRGPDLSISKQTCKNTRRKRVHNIDYSKASTDHHPDDGTAAASTSSHQKQGTANYLPPSRRPCKRLTSRQTTKRKSLISIIHNPIKTAEKELDSGYISQHELAAGYLYTHGTPVDPRDHECLSDHNELSVDSLLMRCFEPGQGGGQSGSQAVQYYPLLHEEELVRAYHHIDTTQANGCVQIVDDSEPLLITTGQSNTTSDQLYTNFGAGGFESHDTVGNIGNNYLRHTAHDPLINIAYSSEGLISDHNILAQGVDWLHIDGLFTQSNKHCGYVSDIRLCFKEDIIGKGYDYQDRAAHTFQHNEDQGLADTIQAMDGLHIVDDPGKSSSKESYFTINTCADESSSSLAGNLESTCFDHDIIDQSYNQQGVEYNPFQHKDQQRTGNQSQLGSSNTSVEENGAHQNLLMTKLEDQMTQYPGNESDAIYWTNIPGLDLSIIADLFRDQD